MFGRVVDTVVDALEYILDGSAPKPLSEEAEDSGWALLDYWPKDLSPEGDHNHSFSFEIFDSGTLKEVAEIKEKTKDSLQSASGKLNPNLIFNSMVTPVEVKPILKPSGKKQEKKLNVTFWDREPAGELVKMIKPKKVQFKPLKR
jgi:hypothetical protein